MHQILNWTRQCSDAEFVGIQMMLNMDIGGVKKYQAEAEEKLKVAGMPFNMGATIKAQKAIEFGEVLFKLWCLRQVNIQEMFERIKNGIPAVEQFIAANKIEKGEAVYLTEEGTVEAGEEPITLRQQDDGEFHDDADANTGNPYTGGD